MDIPYEKQFHFRDGTAVASIEQLKDRLEHISYQDFYTHVNTEKNDFASWIRYVLKEEALSDELRSVTSIVETVEIINDFLHPLPVMQPRNDVQSLIEKQTLAERLPSDITPERNSVTGHGAVPERSMPERSVRETLGSSPSISLEPASAVKVDDFTVVEERFEKQDVKITPLAQEELFGVEDRAKEQLAKEQPGQVVRQKALADDYESRMIVKEFIYGLLTGLIIGVILGKILTF